MKIAKISKVLTCLITAALLATSISGCSSNKKDTTSSQGKTTLTLWDYFEGVNSQQGLKDLTDSFNASQSNIVVKSVFYPRAELDKQLSIGLISANLPDLVLIDNCDYASYVSMGLFADETTNLTSKTFSDSLSQFYPGPLNSCKANGKYYGIPFGCNDLGFYYNKDMFSAAGISSAPTTWDEMTSDCAILSKNGVFGMAISAIGNDEGSFQFMPWLISTGANYNNINSTGGIKSLQLVQDLVNKGYMSTESINWTQADAEKQFATGKAAMMVNGPWNIASVQTDAPKLNFGIVEVPKDQQYASVIGGENMGIIKGHNEAAGWQFVQFTANNELDYTNAMGYVPARKDASAKDTVLTSDPLTAPFVNILSYASPRGPSAKWPAISTALYTAEQQVMLNKATPAAAAKQAQDSIDSALK